MDPRRDIEDIPLYASEGVDKRTGREQFTFIDFIAPEVLRPLFTRKEAKFQKVHGNRAAVLTSGAMGGIRARALSSSGATQALSTTYTENLYPDSPEQLKYKKENDIEPTVTATRITLKKLRHGGFVPWSDNDRFPRKRFDPDRFRPVGSRSFLRDRAFEAAREKFGLGAIVARS